jgi:hypothetical protein
MAKTKHLNLKYAVTSSLDHPVGIAHACVIASELLQKFPDLMLTAGCLSVHAYESNPFSQALQIEGPYLGPITGWGVGFDALLEQLPWEKLL